MATYKEFQRQAKRKRRHQRMKNFLAILSILLMIAVLAFLVMEIIHVMEKRKQPEAEEPVSSVAESIAPPTEKEPVQERFELAPIGSSPRLASETAMLYADARMLALPENEHGAVDISYFADAVFVGDSLTEGVEIYNHTKYPETTQYLWMRGINPMSFVTGTWNATAPNPNVNKSEKYYTNPMDDVHDAHPGKIYLMLGTNGLAAGLTDEIILKYYAQVLDGLQQRCPGTIIYVQSITPVGAVMEEKYPAERVRNLNNQIAALAVERGCVYLDLHEVLADETDHMNPEWASKDGWHMSKTPDGYEVWYQYLLTHTVHQPTNIYVADPLAPAPPATEVPAEGETAEEPATEVPAEGEATEAPATEIPAESEMAEVPAE